MGDFISKSSALDHIRPHACNFVFQEVFGEIQRLKDEANRFIAILSAEDESDEHLSPERKQTLTREVESLQVSSTTIVIFNTLKPIKLIKYSYPFNIRRLLIRLARLSHVFYAFFLKI